MSSKEMDSSKFHPPKESCDVPIKIRMLGVLGNFISWKEYGTFLHICENGIQGTTSSQLRWYLRVEDESKLMHIDFFSIMKSGTFNQSAKVMKFIALVNRLLSQQDKR